LGTQPFLSDHWHRVEGIACRLRSGLVVSRQRFRGRAWYIVHDPRAHRSHRMTPESWAFLNRLDGRVTLGQAWDSAVHDLGEGAPGQGDVVELLAALHAADLLEIDRVPDVDELADRGRRFGQSLWLRNVRSPLALRLPLWDCNRFLESTRHVGFLLFSRAGLLILGLWIVPAIWLAAVHHQELAHDLPDRLLAAENIAGIFIVFCVVKLIHELGHAYAVKAGGGAVHEFGIMVLVFAPVPYVDASAATAFRSKGYRAVVGAAGMIVEVALASAALYLWLLVEPGLVRSLLGDAIAVAGISTIVFNANPLLRFDGYYILCDLIEIPNLAQRSNRYWIDLVRRHLFGERGLRIEDITPGERHWFLAYAPLSMVYRLLVAVGIALFVATEYPTIGALLALLALGSALFLPILKGFRFLIFDPALGAQRSRALAIAVTIVGLPVAAACAIPVPLWLVAEGVVWVPLSAEVRAPEVGIVRRLSKQHGDPVTAGDLLMELESRELDAELAAQRSRVKELDIRVQAELSQDPVRAALLRDELGRERYAAALLEARRSGLLSFAGAGGQMLWSRPSDLPQRQLARGELVGIVTPSPPSVVRIVVTQADAGLMRAVHRSIRVALADRPGDPVDGRVVREVPEAERRLPSPVLGTAGGGAEVLDPRDPNGETALSPVFQFDVELLRPPPDLRVGTRAFVRVELDEEPVAAQIWRRLRQLFLTRLNV
jgi:putative peptide zinc metalloprotease protein